MGLIVTKDKRFNLRFALPEDASLVVDYMRKLGSLKSKKRYRCPNVFHGDGQACG